MDVLQSILESSRANEPINSEQRAYLFEEFHYETSASAQSLWAQALHHALVHKHMTFLISMFDLKINWGKLALGGMKTTDWVSLFDYCHKAGVNGNFANALAGRAGNETVFSTLEACLIQPHWTKWLPSSIAGTHSNSIKENPWPMLARHYAVSGQLDALRWVFDHQPHAFIHTNEVSAWCANAALNGADGVVEFLMLHCLEHVQVLDILKKVDFAFFYNHQGPNAPRKHTDTNRANAYRMLQSFEDRKVLAEHLPATSQATRPSKM